MEGIGSRLGRSSSRYGPTATTVFNGPVRKWKKKWVHVAQSQPSTVRYDQTAQSNGQKNSLLLRCWTPTTVAGEEAGVSTEERPRRKFRYTPIVVVEEKRKVTELTSSDKAQINDSDQSEAEEKPNKIDYDDNDLKKETMITEKSEIDDDSESDTDIASEDKEAQTEKSSEFWSTSDDPRSQFD